MMTEAANPYESPSTLCYYSDDITALPLNAVMRLLRAQPGNLVAKAILLAIVVVRKLFHSPFPPSYGIPEPDCARRITPDQIPVAAKNAIDVIGKECEAEGFRLVHYVCMPYIGRREAYSASFLNEDGTMVATIGWIHMAVGSQEGSKTVFSCHSYLANGKRLHTVAGKLPNLGLTFPDDETVSLAPKASVREVVSEHHRRLKGYAREELTAVVPEQLFARQLDDSKRLFARMIAEGFYLPLSEKDVQRLASMNM